MDALDRTFRHLVQTIQTRYPAYLAQPFEVAELYQNILPYRHHRRELGLETNQDYEMVLLQLLSGARDYLIIDEHMRDRLTRELAAPNPDPGAFREFSTIQISLSPTAVRRVLEGSAAPEPAMAASTRTSSSEPTQRLTAQRAAAAAASAPSSAPASIASAAAPSKAAAPAPPPPAPRRSAATITQPTPRASVAATAAPTSKPSNTIVPQAGEQCRYCSGILPTGRRITFCPHCGQNLTVVNCLACGTELELGWKFCTTCGRPVPAQ